VQEDLKRYKELPFDLLEYSPHLEIRKFDSKLTEEETQWHRDAEDRLVRKISGEGWLIQLDEQIPAPLRSEESYFIPAGVWHRVIRTDTATDLVVQVHKRCKDSQVMV
jgi:quercetin dioxygenase-like cupin family protein